VVGERGTWFDRTRRFFLGRPRDFTDPGVFHKTSLIAFLAWVGLGSDGLSSSAYGPEECFKALLERGSDSTYLAVLLVVATAFTVFVISYAYSRVIEHFPTGGGGYVVASKLLGPKAGVVSGAALLVDYILTITVSIAAGGDAVFNMLPIALHCWKMPLELAVIGVLVILNLRGVKESVTPLVPVFLLFAATHLVLILGSISTHLTEAPAIVRHVSSGFRLGLRDLGSWGVLLVFMAAYARGAGTYTGIEAVSNGLQIMREPRVATGKRTMVYMAASLAFTAGGILLCYLLAGVHPVEGRTMNGVLVERFAHGWHLGGLPIGRVFIVLTIVSEAVLLFVAGQTGFIDGPRVMANMAVDSWLPHRFASLSDRLTTSDGVLLLGVAAAALLYATGGRVDALVVLYAINVFVTFSLSQLGMCRFWIRKRGADAAWVRRLAVHGVGLILCLGILAFTVIQKFTEGAWLTLVITGALVLLCLATKRHYANVSAELSLLDADLANLSSLDGRGGTPRPTDMTAVLLVGSYGGLGVHSILSIQRTYPNYFKNLIFVSVAVLDSGSFKGEEEVGALRSNVGRTLDKYVDLARRLGWNSDSRAAVGLDAVDEAAGVCLKLAQEFPRVVFFAGKLIWKRETWLQRILHNETAYQVQRRLHWKGLAMSVLPVRVGDHRGTGSPGRNDDLPMGPPVSGTPTPAASAVPRLTAVS
jgi:amino acid transporter